MSGFPRTARSAACSRSCCSPTPVAAARVSDDGALVPLAEQDRGLWDAQVVAEGTALITHTLATAAIGPYQLQAALAAVHDEAPRAEDTTGSRSLVSTRLLRTIAPGPMVTLNRIVAVAMVVDRAPACASSPRPSAIRRSTATTASMRFVRICSRCRATWQRPAISTVLRLNEP